MYAKDLLRYRKVWLGLAMIWIMLFHCPLSLGPLDYLTTFGYGGVDICLFASGIGCFYSLSSDSDAFNFMKRRIKRLAPTYVVFIIAWIVYQYCIGNFSFQMAIGNLFAFQNFTGHGYDFNWYISAIFLLYLLAPYFKAIVEKTTPVRKYIFLLFLLVCSVPFWNSNTYIITITRLPIFYMGMLFADRCKKDNKISMKDVILMVASFAAGIVFLRISFLFGNKYLWACGLYWYPFILLTPPMCVAISYISMLLEKTKITKPVVSFISLFGEYSFELYLLHIPLVAIIPVVIEKYSLSDVSTLIWAAGVVAIAVGCYVLKQLAKLLSRIF